MFQSNRNREYKNVAIKKDGKVNFKPVVSGLTLRIG